MKLLPSNAIGGALDPHLKWSVCPVEAWREGFRELGWDTSASANKSRSSTLVLKSSVFPLEIRNGPASPRSRCPRSSDRGCKWRIVRGNLELARNQFSASGSAQTVDIPQSRQHRRPGSNSPCSRAHMGCPNHQFRGLLLPFHCYHYLQVFHSSVRRNPYSVTPRNPCSVTYRARVGTHVP